MNMKLEIKFAPVNESNSWQQPIKFTGGKAETRAASRFFVRKLEPRSNVRRLNSRPGSATNATSFRERVTRRRLFTSRHSVDHLAPVAAMSA